MEGTCCPQCKKQLEQLSGAAFCPFCGCDLAKVDCTESREPAEVLEAVQKAIESEDPAKKHAALVVLEEQYPQSLVVARELLHLGRLYERGKRNADFSIIKCHLLTLYLEPEQFSKKKQAEMREELFAHPQLEKCLSLCEDEDAFWQEYLMRMSEEFINLFLRGDSRYMRRIFGLALDTRAEKLLAPPATRMLLLMRADQELTGEQRDRIMRAFYQAFSANMRGETQWLDEKLRKEGLSPIQ